MDDHRLTVSDAAKILNRTPDTVRRHEREGRLQAMRTPSGYRLFRESDVRRLAEALALAARPAR